MEESKMIASGAHHARCMIRGAPAVVTFYPDSRIVRISAEGGKCFEEMRWLFGWQALLEAIGYVDHDALEPGQMVNRSWSAQPSSRHGASA
jgi:hypothetical protein